MPKFDWNRIQRAKSQHRDVLAALSPAQKLEIIERLRDEGFAMRRPHVARPAKPIAPAPVESGTAIVLNLLGADATLVAAVTARSNSTSTQPSLTIRTP